MNNKRTIYFGQPLVNLTAECGPREVSNAINTAVERYQWVCKHHSIELTEAEARILYNTLNGTHIDELLLRHLHEEILESDDGELPAAKALAEKIESASMADIIGTLEKLGF